MTNSEIHWESLEANLERVNNTANVSTDQESNVSGQNITVMAVGGLMVRGDGTSSRSAAVAESAI